MFAIIIETSADIYFVAAAKPMFLNLSFITCYLTMQSGAFQKCRKYTCFKVAFKRAVFYGLNTTPYDLSWPDLGNIYM